MATLLSSARNQQREHKSLIRKARREIRRRAETRGHRQAAALLAVYQLEVMDVSIDLLPDILAEQGIRSTPLGRPVTEALVSAPAPVVERMDMTETVAEFERLVATLIADAAREAEAVAAVAEPEVTRYVRLVAPPCCGRCAVLAGKVYRWSTGFQRHPRCDCEMVPTNEARAGDLALDPDELFRQGAIRGLSRADVKALNMGADLGQVVNVRSRKAGLRRGSSVLDRRGRPTPAGIFASTTSKTEALALLRRHGYIR